MTIYVLVRHVVGTDENRLLGRFACGAHSTHIVDAFVSQERAEQIMEGYDANLLAHKETTEKVLGVKISYQLIPLEVNHILARCRD